MSRQKSPVSLKEAQDNFGTINPKNKNSHYKNSKRIKVYKKYTKEYDHGDSSSSLDHRPRSKIKHENLLTTESYALNLKLKEIQLLRAKIECLEEAIRIEHNSSESGKDRKRNCFSFFDICKRNKTNRHIQQLSNQIINLQGEDSAQDILYRNQKLENHVFSFSSPKLSQDKKKGRLHNITNNNTIVLPENFCPSRSSQVSQDVIFDLRLKLDRQNLEIRDIKESVKECLKLLKQTNHFKSPDDFFKPNKTVYDFHQFLPYFKKEDLFQLLIKSNENKLKENYDCKNYCKTDEHIKPSDVKPKVSNIRYSDSKSNTSCCRTRSKKRRTSTNSRKKPKVTYKNSATMKASPLTIRNMPKEVRRSLSNLMISMNDLRLNPTDDSDKSMNLDKSDSQEFVPRKERSLERAKRKVRNCRTSFIKWFKYIICRGRQ